MENVTSFFIDDLNNYFAPNEHLKESVQVFKSEYYYLVYDKSYHIFTSDSPIEIVIYLFNNYKVVS